MITTAKTPRGRMQWGPVAARVRELGSGDSVVLDVVEDIGNPEQPAANVRTALIRHMPAASFSVLVREGKVYISKVEKAGASE